nr:unnamed protein product [Callosobruchus chinensis]
MYFQFTNGDTQLTFAVGNRAVGGEQPRAIGAGAVGQGSTSGAGRRSSCGPNNCNGSKASMSTLSSSRNSTMALMAPPDTSQVITPKSGTTLKLAIDAKVYLPAYELEGLPKGKPVLSSHAYTLLPS